MNEPTSPGSATEYQAAPMAKDIAASMFGDEGHYDVALLSEVREESPVGRKAYFFVTMTGADSYLIEVTNTTPPPNVQKSAARTPSRPSAECRRRAAEITSDRV